MCCIQSSIEVATEWLFSVYLQESVRQCCEQTIFSWLNAEMEAKLESHMKKKRPNQKKVVVNSREIRAVIGENQKYVLNDYAKQNSAHDSTGDVHSDSSTLGQSTGFTPLDPPKNPSLLDSNRSDMTLRTDGFEFGAAGSQASSLMLKPTSPTEYNHTAFPEMLALSPKGRGIESVNGRMKEKKSDTDTREDSLMKENEAVVFKEREQKQAYSDMDTQYKTEKTYQSVSPHQAQQQPNGQTATSLASSHDCDGCKTGKGCECNKDIGAEAKGTFLNKGWQKTPRTDEAVWAAAALGFLLVLLTLSVLHTRLYRHWRTMPSLYWHDPQQDYDNVAGGVELEVLSPQHCFDPLNLIRSSNNQIKISNQILFVRARIQIYTSSYSVYKSRYDKCIICWSIG